MRRSGESGASVRVNALLLSIFAITSCERVRAMAAEPSVPRSPPIRFDPPARGAPRTEVSVAATPPPRDLEAERREEERAAFDRTYPLHAVVVHYLAQVFARPESGARVIGYARRGTKLRVGERTRGTGCPQGWHSIPGGGSICAGAGFLVGTTPQEFEPSPMPPALTEALPYPYSRTARDDVPQYWRIPTRDEERAAITLFQSMRAEEERRARAAAVPSIAAAAGSSPTSAAGVSESGNATPEAPMHADAVEAPPPPGQTAVAGTANEARSALPDYLRARMLTGFFVSLDERAVADDGREFVRTVRGGLVRADDLVDANPPTMRGVVVGGDWQLPIAFVFRTGAHGFNVGTEDRMIDLGTVPRHTTISIAHEIVRRDRRFYVGRDGLALREPAVRVARAVPRPPSVPTNARWIHVSLSSQTLVAYEGTTPVFATLVSSGKEGYATPTGVFQIQSKHVSTTMDDEMAADGAYSIEDVPWTMYFQGNFALHGAFWHNAFGTVRSHGCVNLAPVDARWLFQWTTPALPAGWHGVFSERARPGTFVVIDP